MFLPLSYGIAVETVADDEWNAIGTQQLSFTFTRSPAFDLPFHTHTFALSSVSPTKDIEEQVFAQDRLAK
jgi:hypothetical protein